MPTDLFLIFASMLFSIAFLAAIVTVALAAIALGHPHVAREVLKTLNKFLDK